MRMSPLLIYSTGNKDGVYRITYNWFIILIIYFILIKNQLSYNNVSYKLLLLFNNYQIIRLNKF